MTKKKPAWMRFVTDDISYDFVISKSEKKPSKTKKKDSSK